MRIPASVSWGAALSGLLCFKREDFTHLLGQKRLKKNIDMTWFGFVVQITQTWIFGEHRTQVICNSENHSHLPMHAKLSDYLD